VTESLKGSVNKLVVQHKRRDPLPAPTPASPIVEAEGFAQPQTPSARPGSSGMAWPLTETAFEDRETFAEETLYTSDGIFSWTRQRYKSLKMTDDNGNIGKIILKEPVA
jgi:hypothetical protein